MVIPPQKSLIQKLIHALKVQITFIINFKTIWYVYQVILLIFFYISKFLIVSFSVNFIVIYIIIQGDVISHI